jgi:hypothetical protein
MNIHFRKSEFHVKRGTYFGNKGTVVRPVFPKLRQDRRPGSMTVGHSRQWRTHCAVTDQDAASEDTTYLVLMLSPPHARTHTISVRCSHTDSTSQHMYL